MKSKMVGLLWVLVDLLSLIVCMYLSFGIKSNDFGKKFIFVSRFCFQEWEAFDSSIETK